jgi:hypothetical protein
VFFPLPMYIIALALGWFAWRRHWRLDRNEALFFYLLFVAGIWGTILTDSILSERYAAPYGQQVFLLSSVGSIIVGGVGILVYLFWPQPKTPLTGLVERLTALSPIHTMIMAIEKVSPRKASFGPYAGIGIGRFVRFDTPALNLDKVRAVFSEHADTLGDHHLEKWLDFEKQIRENQHKGGFWVGRREWEWFDELETEYRDTVNAKAHLPPTAPEIAVKISSPFVCEPSTLSYLLRKEVPSLQIYRCQCLTVKATTTKIKSLWAEVRVDHREPYVPNWAPKPSEPISENPKRTVLFREEEVRLPVWYATKQLVGPEEGYPVELTVISDDVFRLVELDRREKLTIDIEIRFLAENYADPKPRLFKLTAEANAKSWDDLALTEIG